MSNNEDGGTVQVHDAEYLAASGGTLEGQPKVILTFRPMKDCWGSLDFAISPEQAERMREDLDFVLANYTALREPPPPEEFEPIQPEVDPEPPSRNIRPKRRRKG